MSQEKKHATPHQPLSTLSNGAVEEWKTISYLYAYTKRLALLWESNTFSRIDYWLNKVYFGGEGDYPNLHSHVTIQTQKTSRQLLERIKIFNSLFENGQRQEQDCAQLYRELDALINLMKPWIEPNPNWTPYQRMVMSYTLNGIPQGIIPELDIFFKLCKMELTAIRAPENYAEYWLSWKALREMHEATKLLKQAFINKNYWDSVLNKDMSRWAAKLGKKVIQQIDIFSSWFSKEQILAHRFDDNHPSCRRATQDLCYLFHLFSVNFTTLQWLLKDLPAVKQFLESFYKNHKLFLIDLLTKYEKNYKSYFDLLAQIEKLQEESFKKKSSHLPKDMREAVKEALDKEEACASSLEAIGILLDPTYNQELISTVEREIYNQMQPIIKNAVPAVRSEPEVAEEKEEKEVSGTQAATDRSLPQKILNQLLDFAAFGQITPSILALKSYLERLSFTFISSDSEAEEEKSRLLALIRTFTSQYDMLTKILTNTKQTESQQETVLLELNANFKKLLSMIKRAKAISHYQDIWGSDNLPIVEYYLEKVIRQYQEEMYKRISKVQKTSKKLECMLTKLAQEQRQLQQEDAVLPSAYDPLHIKFLIRQSCQEQLAQKRPLEDSLRNIKSLLVTGIFSKQKTVSKTSLLISEQINKALEALPEPTVPDMRAFF